mmetsp:Transcript_53624/g.123281  ORF Transcript_53624/g.123281 Transcript_53624/m.123281 type:complete len:284 (+) Transcript_53624:672-1523(+)
MHFARRFAPRLASLPRVGSPGASGSLPHPSERFANASEPPSAVHGKRCRSGRAEPERCPLGRHIRRHVHELGEDARRDGQREEHVPLHGERHARARQELAQPRVPQHARANGDDRHPRREARARVRAARRPRGTRHEAEAVRRENAVGEVGATRDEEVVRAGLLDPLDACDGLRAAQRLEHVALAHRRRGHLRAVRVEVVQRADRDGVRVGAGAGGDAEVGRGCDSLGVEEAEDGREARWRADFIAHARLIHTNRAVDELQHRGAGVAELRVSRRRRLRRRWW